MKEDSGADRLLLEGKLDGSCGAAVVLKNCVVKKWNAEGGSAVRTVQKGTLVQVWRSHNDVHFSTAVPLEERVQIDGECLVCKMDDVALVEGRLWGALFPLREEARIAIATDAGLASRLASVDVGTTVQLVGAGSQVLAYASVLYRNQVPGLRPGVYFGVRLLGSAEGVAKVVSVVGSSHHPTGCDAVVTLQHLRPVVSPPPDLQSPLPHTFRTTLLVERDDSQGWMPKSLSHQTLRPTEEGVTRRQASRSLDLSTSAGKGRTPRSSSERLHVTSRSLDLPSSSNPHVTSRSLDLPSSSNPHVTSRSLDLPSSSNRRLARGRACASLDSDPPAPKSTNVEKAADDELSVGSLVELDLRNEPHYGVIRWIGRLGDAPPRSFAGVEMEDELDVEEDVDTRGLFSCPPYKALFVPLSLCRRDSRFHRTGPTLNSFGLMDCPAVEGTIAPISSELLAICGKNRGIQGHHNSCYLDATLFAMFAFTSVFDSLLYRPRTKADIPQYEEVQRVLRDEIVNPLRRNVYVRADRVMKLRTLLEQLSSVTGLTSEEKDPEEFLNSLLAQILKADPFLQLSSGQEAFHYQLFVEKDERLNVPTVQQLLEQSFLASNIKLKRLPPCLIVQMPRFGKAFKMYPRILPPTVLDVTDVIENSPRQCTVCGKLAELECKECYQAGLEGGSFCVRCLETAHSHPSRSRHVAHHLHVPMEFRELQEHCAVPRLTMHLFAVVCIETSHYVAFLNTDRGWVFFDSMADRKGEQNGYNIPEMRPCPDLPFWLSEEGAATLADMQDERQLPDLPKRLLCDAYMCMYQSPDVMMYR